MNKTMLIWILLPINFLLYAAEPAAAFAARSPTEDDAKRMNEYGMMPGPAAAAAASSVRPAFVLPTLKPMSDAERAILNNNLTRAITSYKIEDMGRALEAGADPNHTQIGSGLTPLHCCSKYVPMIELLLNARANPNSSTRSGLRPLHYMADSGNTAGVEMLVRYGADVNTGYKDGYDRTPVRRLLEKKKHKKMQALLLRLGREASSFGSIVDYALGKEDRVTAAVITKNNEMLKKCDEQAQITVKRIMSPNKLGRLWLWPFIVGNRYAAELFIQVSRRSPVPVAPAVTAIDKAASGLRTIKRKIGLHKPVVFDLFATNEKGEDAWALARRYGHPDMMNALYDSLAPERARIIAEWQGQYPSMPTPVAHITAEYVYGGRVFAPPALEML